MAELNFILQSDHLDLYEPRGLVTLALTLIATTMNVRIGKEMRDIKFCDFTYVYNPDKTLAYIVYSPDRTKKDQGDHTTTKAALAFKRPIALRVGDGNNKFDLANVLAHLRHHVELLGLPADIDSLELFWEMKNLLPKQGESFFYPRVNIHCNNVYFHLIFSYFSAWGILHTAT